MIKKGKCNWFYFLKNKKHVGLIFSSESCFSFQHVSYFSKNRASCAGCAHSIHTNLGFTLFRDFQLDVSLFDPSVSLHLKIVSSSSSKYNGENLKGTFLKYVYKSELKLFTLLAKTISTGRLFHVSTTLCENDVILYLILHTLLLKDSVLVSSHFIHI